ncbi:uncharacterized protein LOC133302458 [Gastrolobium bilobum]|uniref:uncharacterized protein LOC133302458 n=1 Tax=Gastrolobium bilobum TaxID=150636 RepID=UPI002AB2BB3F|nr:uncharacterized protein LOC133302458 [Gastrolobium bilobum]
MDIEKPHRTTSSNSSSKSELFVCFTSRLSSSSMKLSSKSILSPSRSRDPPQISLSSSLSRRLKSNGSMKGGQASPMFPTGGKRRGCGFENPEPSSPKVTCIGQVRVKTKKQGKKMRARSKRRGGGEASFRKTTEQNFQHRNQRWVHLPLTICEALREFSCFFPCRSSCMSSEREKEKSARGGGVGSGGGDGREGSCGAAFAKWVVAMQEGEGKGRGIELVMGEEEEEDDDDDDDDDNDGRHNAERSHSQRRHVFEDIDIDVVEGKKHEEFVGGGEEEEKARVSICIPPKNALLLMRCRSDPVKMAALANRFWESPVQKHHEDFEEEDNDDEDTVDEEEEQEEEGGGGSDEDQHIEMEEDEEQEQEVEGGEIKEDSICDFVAREEEEAEPEVKESSEIESNEVTEANQITNEKDKEEDEGNGDANANHQDETFSCVSLPEAHADLDKPETQEEGHLQGGKEKKENNESSELSSTPSTFIASEPQNDDVAKAEAEAAATAETSAEGSNVEEEEKGTEAQETDPTHEGSDPDPQSKERENESKEERERQRLPECLLLMMCEPKLSMEVSKETWVCSTDFIRWLPERPAGKTNVAGGAKRVIADSSSKLKPKLKPSLPPHQPLMQPPRSSCSFPAAGGPAGMSMATMIEQKLVGSKSNNGYEPFLTRCKSEPMRSSSKLAAEACFWNNRKLEPHPPPAPAPAGVGF